MDDAPTQNDLMKYAHALRRRKWFVIVPSVVLGVGATLFSMTLPDRFRSTTMILVTPQKLPVSIVASTVTTDLQDRLNTITQQILSRTALEQVMGEFNLFAKQKKEGKPSEEIIDLMRSRITIAVDRGARRNEAFEVGYVDADPRTAQAVTNRLAGLFIEENLKVREQQAAGTSQFLADEIERYKNEVRDKEQAIYQFKSRHMNELAEQQASNQARLAQLQSQLQINSQNINSAKDRKVLLQQQLAEIEKRVQAERDRSSSEAQSRRSRVQGEGEAGVGGGGSLDEPVSSAERELLARREELARLRLTHTDKHPDVAQLAGRVRQLEVEVAQKLPRGKTGRQAERNGSGSESPGDPRVEYPPIYSQLKLDSQRADAEIARVARENEQIQRSIEVYQSRIGAAPTRELQMKQLSEGYNNVKAVLESLTDKKLQADLSENMERKQKGEQFRILDPANLPERPTSPNRIRFVAGGFLGGAALGIGLIFFLDFVSPGVRTREELEKAVEVPVLGVIPAIVTAEDLVRRKAFRLWGTGATTAAVLIIALGFHVLVRPLPKACADFYHRVKTTHWTAAKPVGAR